MIKCVHILLLILSCVVACQSPDSNKQVGDDSAIVNESAKARIDSALQTLLDSGKVVGISALIVEKGKEVYFNAVGFADREAHTPMDRNTIVRIYSMTKPITGSALMKLHEQGAFQLDDPISNYAPEFSGMKVFTGVDASGKILTEPAKRPITSSRHQSPHSGVCEPGPRGARSHGSKCKCHEFSEYTITNGKKTGDPSTGVSSRRSMGVRDSLLTFKLTW